MTVDTKDYSFIRDWRISQLVAYFATAATRHHAVIIDGAMDLAVAHELDRRWAMLEARGDLFHDSVANDALREKLRIAESVRDDARAASARDLAARRKASEECDSYRQESQSQHILRLQRMLDMSEKLRAERPTKEDLAATATAAWKKGVQESIDKLYAAAVSGVVGASDPNNILLSVGRIIELLNILMKNPPPVRP